MCNQLNFGFPDEQREKVELLSRQLSEVSIRNANLAIEVQEYKELLRGVRGIVQVALESIDEMVDKEEVKIRRSE